MYVINDTQPLTTVQQQLSVQEEKFVALMASILVDKTLTDYEKRHTLPTLQLDRAV